MPAPVVVGRVLAAGNGRRLLGCGCLALASLVALPVAILLVSVNALVGGVGGGGDQVDAGAPGLVVGAGRPLPPGSFRVSQGFGCTAVGLEAPPPRGYSCPPDALHRADVRFHTGVDLAAAANVPVFAVTAGTVHVVVSTGGFGLHVLLAPPQPATPPVLYLYGHLSAVPLQDGTVVSPGELIGYVGSTGNSNGPHLHFEVDVGGLPVNPCSTFPPGYLVPPGVDAVGCVAWAM